MPEKSNELIRLIADVKHIEEGIEEIRKNLTTVSENKIEIKLLTEKIRSVEARFNASKDKYGERIKDLEKLAHDTPHYIDSLKKILNDVEKIKLEAAEKWKKMLWLIISVFTTGGIGFLFQFLNNR